MTHLSIKDVPPEMAEQLRLRAARHHRSLQGELMSILEQALKDPPPSAPAQDWLAQQAGLVRLLGQSAQGPVLRHGWKTQAQIHAEVCARHPKPLAAQASSVALIREDRDQR